MQNRTDHSYSLTRGLGGLFIFAALQFLENQMFTIALIFTAVGVINILPYGWLKHWSAALLYSINTVASVLVFYEFLQLNTTYLQWLWLLILIYYVIRLRDLFIKRKSLNQSTPESDENSEELI